MISLVIDKGCLCNSLQHYPTNMLFFTTPERMADPEKIGANERHVRRGRVGGHRAEQQRSHGERS